MGTVAHRVVTFYSFKGGVGRTFALCDVAVYLARWGYRVLCVDFDLEAPGLDRYFEEWLPSGDAPPGMLEILEAWAQDASDVDLVRAATQVVALPGTEGRLAITRAGRRGDDYPRKLHAVNWTSLFAEQRAGRRLEDLRDRWLDQFDLVLVDSRTGWSDIGQICTIHLPDIVVALFTPNEQSVQGALAVADASKRGVARLPLDRAPLRIVPVLTRVDKDEYDAQQRWTERLLADAARFVDDWDPQEETPPAVLAHLVVPYVPYWAYGERLAATRTELVSSLSVGRAHETLAALLARGLAEAGLLLKHRDSYVAGAVVGGSAETTTLPRVAYDLYISYPSAYQRLALELARALRDRGLSVFIDRWALQPGDRWLEILDGAIQNCRTFAILVEDTLGPSQTMELNAILVREQSGEARVVPVFLGALEELPRSVRNFHGIVAPKLLEGPDVVDVAALAERLLPVALRR